MLTQVGLKLLQLLPAEAAHNASLTALKLGLGRLRAPASDPKLAVQVLGQNFPNPLGLAAGYDKNADVPDAMLALGLGFVEVGTVTPLPQAGNPKPRLFRLRADRAVINRMGFNNHGLEALVAKLNARRGRPGIVGVNIGANKDSTDRIHDYVTGLRAVAGFASYITINISSPNTPGLRGLQDPAQLEDLLGRLIEARRDCASLVPLMLKIAPDLSDEAISDIVALAIGAGIDGMIISNTTIARPASLQDAQASQTGGLSGAPLFDPSTHALRIAARASAGRLVLIGAGGISSAAHAYAKFQAGAHLVQLYSALAYDGPELIRRILNELPELMARDGFESIGAVTRAAHLD
jgi:dihydroorotate dehydrogenase